MNKVSCFSLVFAFMLLFGGQNKCLAQDRDTVWVYYGDSTLATINAPIGDTLGVDVFVQTAPNAYVADIMLVLGFDRQYFDTLLSDVLGAFYYPLSQWDVTFFYLPQGSPPNPEGWMSQALQGFAELNPPYDSPYLHAESPIKIATMVGVTSDNPDNMGRTVDAIGPGLNDPQGPSNAGDTSGNFGYVVTEYFSQVRFAGGEIGYISGHVQNESGEAIADVNIVVSPSEDSTTTDASGNYSFTRVPGIYQLTFNHPAYFDTTVVGVQVFLDQTTAVDVEMRNLPGGIVYGTITDTAGVYLSGIRVYDSGLLSSDTTDFSGEYSLTLPQGSYTIHFDGFGYVDTIVTDIVVEIDDLLEMNMVMRIDPEELDELPDNIDIRQNYPNPFNDGTFIEFTVEKPLQVDVEIFDVLGRKVETVKSFTASAGTNKIWWDPNDIASGIYFCRVRSSRNSESRAMLYIK